MLTAGARPFVSALAGGALIFAAASLALVAVLFALSPQFAWETYQNARPTLQAAVILAGAGGFAAIAWWGWSLPASAPRDQLWPALLSIAAIGFAMRLFFLGGPAIWEDDYFRYLWDGAQIAHGIDPYRWSIYDIVGWTERTPPSALQDLAAKAGQTFERVNNPQLATIYPPVAQAFFVLSYLLAPYDFTVWRLLTFAADAATFVLLARALWSQQLSPLWAAAYWVNPLVAKEAVNSAHVDALMGPFLVLALHFAAQGKGLRAAGMAGLAAGIKLWPVLLVPQLARSVWGKGRLPSLRWIACGALASLMLGLWIAPMAAAQAAGAASGAAAYAESWQRNSWLFALSLDAVTAMVRAADAIATIDPNLIVRAGAAAVVSFVALAIAAPAVGAFQQLAFRLFLISVIWFLLLPAQYPWYAASFVVFAAAARAQASLAAVTILLPLYYALKGFVAIDREDLADLMPWLQHPAILAAVIYDAWRQFARSPDRSLT